MAAPLSLVEASDLVRAWNNAVPSGTAVRFDNDEPEEGFTVGPASTAPLGSKYWPCVLIDTGSGEPHWYDIRSCEPLPEAEQPEAVRTASVPILELAGAVDRLTAELRRQMEPIVEYATADDTERVSIPRSVIHARGTVLRSMLADAELDDCGPASRSVSSCRMAPACPGTWIYGSASDGWAGEGVHDGMWISAEVAEYLWPSTSLLP